MKVYFETFGCRLNRAEALDQEAEYLATGWEKASRPSRADLFVVRCCSVTERAERDCRRFIESLKRRHPGVPLKLEGCIGRIKSSAAMPAADAPVPTSTARAYLKVQDGCNGKCTFCIVPRFRGKARSAPFGDVLSRASRFIEAGYREIVVTGCNLSSYASEGKGLPDLVAALAALDGRTRFRIGSVEPVAGAAETVCAMAENANVCDFLHLAIQSGSNNVLSAMKRPYTMRDVDKIIGTAIRKMRCASLGCDLMSGFPGETEMDHAATKSMLSHYPFSNAHIFKYSERPGTPAAKFGSVVPPSVRSARARELAADADELRKRFARRFAGRTVEIVNEREDGIAGWTEQYLWCEAPGKAPRKAMVKIRVAAARHGRLSGKAL